MLDYPSASISLNPNAPYQTLGQIENSRGPKTLKSWLKGRVDLLGQQVLIEGYKMRHDHKTFLSKSRNV